MDSIKKYLSMVNKDTLKIKVKRRAQKRVCISFKLLYYIYQYRKKSRQLYSLKTTVNTVVQRINEHNIIYILTCAHDKVGRLLHLFHIVSIRQLYNSQTTEG